MKKSLFIVVFAVWMGFLIVSPAVSAASPSYRWHTFYGSSEPDRAYSIVVDSSNYSIIVGRSKDTWNGPLGQGPKHAHSSPGNNADLFVLKLDSGGDYQWHTFYGSSSNDGGNGIAAREGSIYVAGYSFAAWEGPAAQPPRHSYSGQADITVLKLDSAGTYQWHTFYGSASDDFGLDLALNSTGSVFVVGRSLASWLHGSTGPAHQYTGGADLVIVKVDSAGAYGWHTFYGSSDEDLGQDIAVDSSGDIHAAGSSLASWVGDGGALPLHEYTGDQDLFELVLADTAPAPVPSFYGWGLIAFAAVLWASSIRVIRRRASTG